MTTPTVQPANQWPGNNRRTIAYVLLAIALVIGIASAFAFDRAGSSISVPSATGGEASSIPNPLKNEYLSLGIAGILLTLTGLGAGIWFYIDRPKDDAVDRLAILITGACFGVALCMLAVFLFYWWFPELTKWVLGEEKAAAWKPVSSLLLFLVGIGIAFLAAQPATRDQRDNPLTRRMIYGVNLALTVSVLAIALVAANLIVNLKLPGRLDTTENNLTTISDATKNYVGQLNQDITIYSWVEASSEAHRLIERIRDANPQRVTLKHLSLTRDKAEFSKLHEKYQNSGMFDKNALLIGVLMVNESRNSRTAFIPEQDFYGVERDQRGRPGKEFFRGEARMARDLLFLTDDRVKPVIYFTQNAGELSIEPKNPDDPAPNPRTAYQLKAALEVDGCEVKPLKSSSVMETTRIPDDASIVVVADPVTQLSPALVSALKQFASSGRGKLIIMSGAHTVRGSKEISTSGLEELISSYGFEVINAMIYSTESKRAGPDMVDCDILGDSIGISNKINITPNNVKLFGLKRNESKNVRVLAVTGVERPNWIEKTIYPDPMTSFNKIAAAHFNNDEDYLKARHYNEGKNRLITAVTVTDPKEGTPKMAVFGFGNYFVDKDNNTEFSEHSYLLTSTVNWLRERPALANETNKPVGMYTANPRMSFYTVFLFPVVGSLTIVIAAGVCVWALRRK